MIIVWQALVRNRARLSWAPRPGEARSSTTEKAPQEREFPGIRSPSLWAERPAAAKLSDLEKFGMRQYKQPLRPLPTIIFNHSAPLGNGSEEVCTKLIDLKTESSLRCHTVKGAFLHPSLQVTVHP